MLNRRICDDSGCGAQFSYHRYDSSEFLKFEFIVLFAGADERVLEEIIRAQVDRGIQRRDPQEIKKVFEEFAIDENSNRHIPVCRLRDALHALDIMVPGSEDEHEFLRKLDTDKNGKLELNEFQDAILASCTPLEEWAKSWPLAQLLADSIPRCDNDRGHSDDNLTVLGSLNDEQLKLIVRGFAYGLEKMLLMERDKLRRALSTMEESSENRMAEKFEVPEMKCGNIEDFFCGLAARIGILCFQLDDLHTVMMVACKQALRMSTSSLLSGWSTTLMLVFKVATMTLKLLR